MENTRPLITQNIVPVSGRSLSIACLRSLAKNEPDLFLQKIQKGVNEDKLRFSDLRDLKALYGALADVRVNATMTDMAGVTRAISSLAFPILTGTTAIKAINDAYLRFPAIGGMLVEEIDDPKKTTTIAAIHNQDKEKDEVKELEEFPEVGSVEESVEIGHKKNGRKLTISAEMIKENEVANIVQKLNGLGLIAGKHVETQTLKRVTDYDGSASSGSQHVYKPAGTGTALFSATANTPGTRAPSGNRVTSNALVDYTDLSAARTRLRTMTDAQGERIAIPWSEVYVLIPDALGETLFHTLGSTMTPGMENELSAWGPRGPYFIPNNRVLTTPKLDDLSTSAWYMGAFKSQFLRKWKMRFEYINLGMSTQAYLDSQVAAQFRIAWDVEIGATDYVYVVQCLSATTSPKDE